MPVPTQPMQPWVLAMSRGGGARVLTDFSGGMSGGGPQNLTTRHPPRTLNRTRQKHLGFLQRGLEELGLGRQDRQHKRARGEGLDPCVDAQANLVAEVLGGRLELEAPVGEGDGALNVQEAAGVVGGGPLLQLLLQARNHALGDLFAGVVHGLVGRRFG